MGHKPLALGLIAIAVALVAAGVVSRRSQASQVKEASAPVVPMVSVLTAGQAGNAALELPARIEPWARAPIYARVSGYLKSWNVDIGAPSNRARRWPISKRRTSTSNCCKPRPSWPPRAAT
jgi:multidrug efflux pump subunit AcrA (membrane-fusion protein)